MNIVNSTAPFYKLFLAVERFTRPLDQAFAKYSCRYRSDSYESIAHTRTLMDHGYIYPPSQEDTPALADLETIADEKEGHRDICSMTKGTNSEWRK